jgi:hypothetical protein
VDAIRFTGGRKDVMTEVEYMDSLFQMYVLWDNPSFEFEEEKKNMRRKV